MKRAHSDTSVDRDLETMGATISSRSDTPFRWSPDFEIQKQSALLSLASELMERISYSLEPRDRYSLRGTCRQLRMAVDGAWRDIKELAVNFDVPPNSQNAGVAELVRFRVHRSGKSFRPSCKQKQSEGMDSSLIQQSEVKCPVTVKLAVVNPLSRVDGEFSYSILGKKLVPWLKVLGDKLVSVTIEMPCFRVHNMLNGQNCFFVLLRAMGSGEIATGIKAFSVSACVILSDVKWLNEIENITRGRVLKQLTLAAEPSCSSRCYCERERTMGMFHSGYYYFRDSDDEEWQDWHHSGGWMESRLLHSTNRLAATEWQGLLQRIISSCQALEVLNIDGVLKSIPLRLTELHYPPSVQKLVSVRIGEHPGDMRAIFGNCPLLEDVSVSIHKTSPSLKLDLKALGSLEFLKTLTISNLTNPDVLVEVMCDAEEEGREVWRNLQAVTFRKSVLSDSLLLNLCRNSAELNHVKILALKDSAGLTGKGMNCVCQLRNLKLLELDFPFSLNSVFTDISLDYLSDYALNLEILKAKRSSVNVLSIPRLLRRCSHLKVVELDLRLALNTLDTIVMARSIASDMDCREGRTEVEVTAISGGNYESVARILDGIPSNCDLILSDLTEYCLHDKETCNLCKFESHRRSLIIGRKDLRSAQIVFHCSNSVAWAQQLNQF